jgi:hypothetical protein
MINLYKIPGSYIFCFVGPFGVGKSLGMLEQAALTADRYNINIVSNFPIDKAAFDNYCDFMQYKNVSSNNLFFVDSVEEFFEYRGAIYLLDEASIYLFSRDFKKTGVSQLLDLFQLRKYTSFLYYTCQNVNQIDSQLRSNTQTFVLCSGLQRFSPKRKKSILYSRKMMVFSIESYELLLTEGASTKLKFFRPWILSGFRSSSRNLIILRLVAFIKYIFQYILDYYSLGFSKSVDTYGALVAYSAFSFLPFIYLKILWPDFVSKSLNNCFIQEDYLFSCYDSFNVVKGN